jgi:hypothetical protein
VLRITLLLVGVFGLASLAQASPPDPTSDHRLAAVRAPLRAVLDDADRRGLPRDLLQNKIREGLAKAVPPPRILAVVQGMRDDLVRARARARARLGVKHPPAPLLRALLEAQHAGVPAATVDALFGSLDKRAWALDVATRAVEALTDLTLAGYPGGRALRVVSLVAAHDPGALGRLIGDLERLRRAEALTAAEAIDAVAHNLERGDPVDKAIKGAQADASRGHAAERGRGSAPAGGKKPR